MNGGWKCPTCGIGVSPYVSACPECVKARNNRPPKNATTVGYIIESTLAIPQYRVDPIYSNKSITKKRKGI